MESGTLDGLYRDNTLRRCLHIIIPCLVVKWDQEAVRYARTSISVASKEHYPYRRCTYGYGTTNGRHHDPEKTGKVHLGFAQTVRHNSRAQGTHAASLAIREIQMCNSHFGPFSLFDFRSFGRPVTRLGDRHPQSSILGTGRHHHRPRRSATRECLCASISMALSQSTILVLSLYLRM
ncbi:hypothetical protein N656DRAFT_242518 [Canariomyces notabilis]|uniref:Uncharacterized protein n=1 Tax=Canariomyces notabilis TaxID=2074819 RepID=A0AAN6TL24_9PEZI|nr:hypothetical protein N656DRAFT_242518 [Canariomyces arenarius]